MSRPAANLPVIVDSSGNPLRANAGAYYGADRGGTELRSWTPALQSADAELLPDRDTLVARTRDMIRNHGLVSGAVQTHLDNIIGTGLRLSAKPDYVALGQSAEWAAEWSRKTESEFRQWAEDIDRFCDAGRRLNLAGMLAQGYRSILATGDLTASMEWQERPGARYSTAVQMIDADRLSNPTGETDSDTLRGGVEMDAMGAPIAYWIRSRHPSDPWQGVGQFSWKRVPRETRWGRRLFIHVFDVERSGQTRGKGGFVSALAKMKMLEKFEQSSLQAAILNAMYAAVVESSMDWTQVNDAMGGDSAGGMASYMGDRADWHQPGNVRYNGVKIPHLYPGEQLKLLSPQHPTAAFSSFEEAVLRHVAGAFNLSYEQMARDYSKSNYSSARASMLEAWRFFTGRRQLIAGEFATIVYACWLEEAIDKGRIQVPPGAPAFIEAKTAWTRCKWIGPGRNHIDPDKESKATERDLAMGVTTLEEECASRGQDWLDIMEQRAIEAAARKKLGLPEPGAPASRDLVLPEDREEDEATPDEETVDTGNGASVVVRRPRAKGVGLHLTIVNTAPQITVDANTTIADGAFQNTFQNTFRAPKFDVHYAENAIHVPVSVTNHVPELANPFADGQLVRMVTETDANGVPTQTTERFIKDESLKHLERVAVERDIHGNPTQVRDRAKPSQ